VIGLTTSGNSANVVGALEVAAQAGMTTVAFTGAGGGKAAATAQICISVPTSDTARAQEACLHLGHTICEMVEAALFPR
jgi:D-sedoheptulose 7-phosphate isomerase